MRKQTRPTAQPKGSRPKVGHPTQGKKTRPAASRRRRRARPTARRRGQLGLDLKERHQHGGRRPGAGRKPTGRRTETPHRARPPLSRNHPVHVTMRTVPGTWNLRTKRCFMPIHRALTAANENPDCRVVHYSVQGNHLHLIVEAEHARALTAGMKGLAVRIARRLNRVMGRKGRVFQRYHAEALTTPRRVRNAVSYVLNNLRRHAAQSGPRPATPWADPYSSARWFDGWLEPAAVDDAATGPPWMRPLPAPSVPPRTWLLQRGWRRHGAVSMEEVPGGPRKKRRPG